MIWRSRGDVNCRGGRRPESIGLGYGLLAQLKCHACSHGLLPADDRQYKLVVPTLTRNVLCAIWTIAFCCEDSRGSAEARSI